MTAPLPLLSASEVRALLHDDDEPSFGCLRCDRGVLPLAAMDVQARIVGLFAHTSVAQTFVNNTGVPVEATYVFPLPDRAAATRFSMEVAGRRVEGDLQERGEARRTYERAIEQGRRAAIAEEERPGTFTLRVGNLMPGERAVIRFELCGPLPLVDGEVSYRFPLVVAPRYIPGTPLHGDDVGSGRAHDTDAVPDASRITPPVLLPGYPNPVQLSLSASIDPHGLQLSRVRSALHAASATDDDGLLRVTIHPGERLDRDFILRFAIGDTAITSQARATKRNDDDDALLLTLVPPMAPTSMPGVRPRDVVFVLDRSGSMRGWKMTAARRAVARMVDTLRDTDRFHVLAFDNVVDVCPQTGDALVAASDRARFRVVQWLSSVDARGGTEMTAPLARAAQLLSSSGLERDCVLVFVTDGQVGNEAQVLQVLGAQLRHTRVFALGIDRAVNAGFMNRLAALGGQGEAELVESEDRIDEVLARCHRRIDTPVLTQLQVSCEGADVVADTIAPSRLPDVFVGVPAVVVSRLRRTGSGPVTVVVTGHDARGQRCTLRVPVETSANPGLLPAWGRLHLRDLEDRFDGGREDRAALQRRIVDVSLRARVLCRFTAFVAVDHEVVNEGGRVRALQQAVQTPSGWDEDVDFDAPGGLLGAAAMPAPSRAPAPMARMREEAPAQARSSSLLERAKEAFAPSPSKKGAAPEPLAEAFADSSADASSLEAPPAAAPARQEERAVSKAAPTTTRQEERARPDLRALRDSLGKLWAMLQRGDALDVVIEAVRLALEEATHAGITPGARQPLQQVLDRLVAGDVDDARRKLGQLLDALGIARS